MRRGLSCVAASSYSCVPCAPLKYDTSLHLSLSPSPLTSLLCVLLSFLLCVWSLNAMPFVKGHDIAYQLKPCVPAQRMLHLSSLLSYPLLSYSFSSILLCLLLLNALLLRLAQLVTFSSVFSSSSSFPLLLSSFIFPLSLFF